MTLRNSTAKGFDTGVFEHVAALARRGHSDYLRYAASFSHLLRSFLSRSISDIDPPQRVRFLRQIYSSRYVQQRQQAYYRAGGHRSSTAEAARSRARRLLEARD